MLKPKFVNVLLFIFVKYLLFYIFLMFKNNDYSLVQIGALKNSEDIFFYFWIFLFLPVTNIFLFSVPIYFVLRVKKVIYFMLLLSIVLIAEYLLYTYFASQTNLMNGVYNGIISLLLLYLFFFQHIMKQTSSTMDAM